MDAHIAQIRMEQRALRISMFGGVIFVAQRVNPSSCNGRPDCKQCNYYFSGGHYVSFNIVGAFELFAAVQGAVIMVILRRMNKKLGSPMLSVEIDGWYIDAVASIGKYRHVCGLLSSCHHQSGLDDCK